MAGTKPSTPKRKYTRNVKAPLHEVGFDAIITRIEGGESQAEIARSFGLNPATVNAYLHETIERSARTKEAMTASAESWLDRGLQTLVDAPPEPAEIARARAIEQHCARRAAIRNPAGYGDKIDVNAKHSGSVGVTVMVAAPSDEAL